jgi:hypothetical protein
MFYFTFLKPKPSDHVPFTLCVSIGGALFVLSFAHCMKQGWSCCPSGMRCVFQKEAARYAVRSQNQGQVLTDVPADSFLGLGVPICQLG